MEENSEESNRKQPRQQRFYPMWLCPVCGTRTWITNKKRHLQTKKHRDALYISTERFEMLR